MLSSSGLAFAQTQSESPESDPPIPISTPSSGDSLRVPTVPESTSVAPRTPEEDSSIFRHLRRRGLLSTEAPSDSARSLYMEQRERGEIPIVPGFDSPVGASPDSLARRRRDRGAALVDSLAMASDSTRIDSSFVAGPWAERLDRSLSPYFVMRPVVWERSTDRVLREIQLWEQRLATVPSGSHFTPDPIDWGDLPGREPPATLVDGLPVAPPGMPEAAPDAVAPSWLRSVEIHRANPLRLPNNPTGGPILEQKMIRPDTTVLVSGIRLSDGSNDSNTDEIYFARPTEKSMAHVFWSDHKTAGRLYYGDESGSNVILRYERRIGDMNAHVGYADQFARVRLVDDLFRPSLRWLWDRSGYNAGAVGTVAGWDVRADASATWHRFAWEGEQREAKRKSTLYQGILRVTGPGTHFRPKASVQADWQRLRFYEPDVLSLDRKHLGIGFAVGGEGVSNGWHYEASVGRSDPGIGDPGWVGALLLDRDFGPRWRFQGYAGRTIRTRLMPRMANHLYTMVGQGLVAPVVDTSPEPEALHTIEARMTHLSPGRRISGWLRATGIEHAISGEGGRLDQFVPEAFLTDPLPPEALDSSIRVLAVHGSYEQGFLYGFGLELQGAARISNPGWKDQLWMTPAEVRGKVSWTFRFFESDLFVETFIRGEWSGSRGTPSGTIAPRNRFDGGAVGEVGSLTMYVLLANLENDEHPSASLIEDGLFMSMPVRSYRIGLSWRFLD